MKKNSQKPKGGKGKRANYSTTIVRIPVPIKKQVEELIEKFHRENEEYMKLPLTGKWWEILGVKRNATESEVKLAYKRLSRLYHPDVNLRRDALVRMKALNGAYEIYQRFKR
ncbi:MAG: DnaJ domain-containing protein [Prochloraceae cyanobacterium]|nr:DnaJ domain-containing protein [Prochloraceae cyanobacterium]